MKQSEIRELIKYHYAIDVTNADEHKLKTFGLSDDENPIIHVIGKSTGNYGINGLLFQECRYSNCLYAVVGRTNNLFKFL